MMPVRISALASRMWSLEGNLDDGRVRDEIQAWRRIHRDNHSLRLIPLAIFWIVLKERNRRAYESS